MKRTTEQTLEAAYVLIAHLAELRMDLQPHSRGPLSQRQQMALAKLFEALQSMLPEDLASLAKEMRALAARGLGFQPDPKDRGEILDLSALVDRGGLSESPSARALIHAMQARCEDIAGTKFIGSLWAGGGESMRAVLTIGGIRVPIMPALETFDNVLRRLALMRAEDMVKARLSQPLEKVQEILDHAAAQLSAEFGDPNAELDEAMKEAAREPVQDLPRGHHRCLKCNTVFNAEELEACPRCKHPRPVWYGIEPEETT